MTTNPLKLQPLEIVSVAFVPRMTSHFAPLLQFGVAGLLAVLVSATLAADDPQVWLTPISIYRDGMNDPRAAKAGTAAGRMAMSPDGKWVVAISNALVVYRRNATNGKLTLVSQLGASDIPGLQQFFFSPDSKELFVTAPDQVVVLRSDEQGERLEESDRIVNGHSNVVGLRNAASGCVSADGKYVYITGYFDHTLVCFHRIAGTGKLVFVECLQDEAASQPLPGTGRILAHLIPTARRIQGIADIGGIASSPDGKQLFVGSRHYNRMTVFDRSFTTGRLSVGQSIEQEAPPKSDRNGIREVEGIAFSANRKLVVTASTTGGVSLFSLSEPGGKMVFEQVYFGNGLPKEVEQSEPKVKIIPDLKNPVAVAFLPDSSALIAASINDHALHAFRVNADTPNLTWLGALRDGQHGITGLNHVHNIAISPDGRFLYAGSRNATVAVFALKL